MDDAQLIDSPRERSALTFVQFGDKPGEATSEEALMTRLSTNSFLRQTRRYLDSPCPVRAVVAQDSRANYRRSRLS